MSGADPIRGMIFDLDGTLADTVPVCCAAFREALAPYVGRELSDAEIVTLFGPSEEGIIQRITGDLWRDCLAAYYAAYERLHASCPAPFPGISALLDRLLERGLPLAVVTGKGPGSAGISLERLGLAAYFGVVECGSPEGSVKPRAIGAVLAAWGLPAAGVAYVGDAPQDVRDARAAGVVPVAAAWASTADPVALAAESPAALFTSVADFAAWLDERVVIAG